MNIRIDQVPPSSIAPEEIRKQWVGIEIPLAEDGSQSGHWTGQTNTNGYVVMIEDAVKALREAYKNEAADFWEGVRWAIGDKLRFKKECCRICLT